MNFNIRSVILICVALGVAGFTAYLARGWLTSETNTKTPVVHAAAPAQVEVLVAKTNIPAGVLIKQDHLRWQAWPDQNLSESYIKKGKRSLEAYIGTVARQPIAAGEPITDDRLVKPGEQGFLAAVLAPGMRAVTVGISSTSGIAGFIFPGDHVDLVLSHGVKVDGKTRRASETVLTDVRVLAIDQSMNDPKEGAARVGKTATLEVTPKQVEKINVARQIGALSLSLRPLRKTDQQQVADGVEPFALTIPETGKTHTWDSEVSRLLPPPHPKSDVQTVKLSRGDKNSSYQFRRQEK
jgi:pilus assembly protein CpaB